MNTALMPRVLGWLTLGYGAYTLLRPDSLAHAAGLEPRDGPTTRSGTALARVIGMRDIISGAAMVAARPGLPLRAAVVARAACDTSDLVGLGLTVPPGSRSKVIAVTAGWGLLNAASLLTTRSPR
jgi:hypothetical protein